MSASAARIRDAAAPRMPGREHHAVEIPSMVDLGRVHAGRPRRCATALGIAETSCWSAGSAGWTPRSASRISSRPPHSSTPGRAVALRRIGGPDAFMPEYAETLRQLAAAAVCQRALTFLGDRADVPALLSALDVFVWLSRGEGMPHVIAEAGAAGLPVVATADNGSMQQIEDGRHRPVRARTNRRPTWPPRSAACWRPDAPSAARAALRAKVGPPISATVVVPQWQALFDEVLAERQAAPAPSLFTSFIQGGFECSTHDAATAAVST